MPPSRYDQKILGLEGERDDLKNVVDQLQTDIREWQEKYDAAQSYRAQLQRGHETEVKSLNEQIDHLEDLCTKSQAAQDEAEAACQLAEADRKAAEAAADDDGFEPLGRADSFNSVVSIGAIVASDGPQKPPRPPSLVAATAPSI